MHIAVQYAKHFSKNLCYFIEEAQDSFNSRSTTRLEAEEFLTVFNEGRNEKEAFFTALQSLSDFSKTVRTKQTYVLGRINSEDKSPAIRQIEKQSNIDLSKMPLRTWFFKGETFVSPNWIQQGKPFICNRQLKAKFNSQQPTKPKKKMGFAKAFFLAMLTGFNPDNIKTTDKEENEETDPEESELDMFMTDSGSVMFSTDDPEEF
jgi:hypothetical protein